MVVSQLNSALAVSGLQIMHSLEQGMQGGGGLVARASVSPTKQVRKGRSKLHASLRADSNVYRACRSRRRPKSTARKALQRRISLANPSCRAWLFCFEIT
jgi:hypothetical protein